MNDKFKFEQEQFKFLNDLLEELYHTHRELEMVKDAIINASTSYLGVSEDEIRDIALNFNKENEDVK